MSNLITKYTSFLLEADSTETQISGVRLEISKLEDQLRIAKDKMVKAKKVGKEGVDQLKAESAYLTIQSQTFGKMIPLLNELKTKLDQRAAELRG